MSFSQRLLFFILGIVLGSVLAGYIMQQRRAAAAEDAERKAALAPVGAEAIQREAVPGIMQAYNRRQVPMHSDFIKSEYARENHPQPGLAERYLVLRGLEPEQELGIVETTQLGADKVWGQLEQVRILGANRLLVRVREGVSRAALAAALEPLEMAVVRGLDEAANSQDPAAPELVRVEEGERWQTPADIETTDLFLIRFPLQAAADIPAALEAVRGLADTISSADFDYLDAGHRFVRREK